MKELFRDVVRVKRNKKGRSCELPLLGLAKGKTWIHGAWKEQSKFFQSCGLRGTYELWKTERKWTGWKP